MIDDLTLSKAVDFAVQVEEQGLHFYKRLARHFAEQAEMQELFSLLARDEALHAKRFAELRQALPPEQLAQHHEKQYLRAVALSDIFAAGEGGIAKQIERIGSPRDALQRAFELEQTTLLYYQALRPLLGDSEVLAAIIAEEQQHVVKIMEYLITGAKMRGLADRGPG